MAKTICWFLVLVTSDFGWIPHFTSWPYALFLLFAAMASVLLAPLL